MFDAAADGRHGATTVEWSTRPQTIMGMIEFEDHSEENQKALLAYMDGEVAHGTRRIRAVVFCGIARLFARVHKWFLSLS